MKQIHHFKIGNYQCTSLLDMVGERDVWQTFPNVPQDQLQAALDEVDMSADWIRHGNVLLIDTGEKKVLIDSGLSTDAGGLLVSNLAEMGLSPSDIDMILVTHGDFDHVGGLKDFPDSEIILPKESYRLWTEELERMVEEFLKLSRDRASAEQLAGMKNGRLQYPQSFPALKPRLKLVDSDTDILRGIRFIAAPGHRRDHFAVEVKSKGETVLHIVDAFRHPIHCQHPNFPCLFDSYPEQLASTIRMLMARAADSDALVYGSHFVFPGLIKIGRQESEFVWLDA
ncbi:MAG: MBL fold metallo-hydrolase [Chloroflexota bacterium]